MANVFLRYDNDGFQALTRFARDLALRENPSDGSAAVAGVESAPPAAEVAAIDLSEEEIQQIAAGLYNASQALSSMYAVSDGISLGMYVLRYMAQIGSYTIEKADILRLVNHLSELTGEHPDRDLMFILERTASLRFEKVPDFRSLRLYRYAVHLETDSPSGILFQIEGDGRIRGVNVRIQNGAAVRFFDVVGSREEKRFERFMTRKARFAGVALEPLNQIKEEMIAASRVLLASSRHRTVDPLRMAIENVDLRVFTTTLIKTLHLDITEAYAIPGLEHEMEPLPSFVLMAAKGLVKVKLSIDQ